MEDLAQVPAELQAQRFPLDSTVLAKEFSALGEEAGVSKTPS